ncbi:hypothetical protein BDQ17DRAFT_1253224 [Cyathus striatus]|nr:hypothetical protein BDQ17DRAFT_1253224 [Cyathus striatus]
MCNIALSLFDSLPWNGHISGFIHGGDMESLVIYLSQHWLTSTHITQNNKLLQLELVHAGLDMSHEVVEDHFFLLLQQFSDNQSTGEYGCEGSSLYHWHIGEELAHRSCNSVWGVANIGEHWVAIGIDCMQKSILYGNLLGNTDFDLAEEDSVLLNALTWWIQIHTKLDYSRSHMPITCQHDPFSCGVLALNAISASVLHESVSLIHESEAIMEWVCMFIQVAKRDIETMSHAIANHECTCD